MGAEQRAQCQFIHHKRIANAAVPIVLTTSVRASECSELQLVIKVLTCAEPSADEENRVIELLEKRLCSHHEADEDCRNQKPDGVGFIGTCSKVRRFLENGWSVYAIVFISIPLIYEFVQLHTI